LIQPPQGPFNTTFPVILHQFIYFFASRETRNTFILNPIKYIRQPKPNPSLPIKLVIIGPPKAGKTTGEISGNKIHVIIDAHKNIDA